MKELNWKCLATQREWGKIKNVISVNESIIGFTMALVSHSAEAASNRKQQHTILSLEIDF